MTEKEEFLAGLAKRLRELRLHLGYETTASFARAIGYPPDKYSRYERRGILPVTDHISRQDRCKPAFDTFPCHGSAPKPE